MEINVRKRRKIRELLAAGVAVKEISRLTGIYYWSVRSYLKSIDCDPWNPDPQDQSPFWGPSSESGNCGTGQSGVGDFVRIVRPAVPPGRR